MPAPVGDVYRALIDPAALTVWLAPGEMSGTIEEFDPRPGGTYRMVLRYPDASTSRGRTTADSDVIEARFVELVPDVGVTYSVDFVSDDLDLRATMVVTWALGAVGEGIRVSVSAHNVPDAVTA